MSIETENAKAIRRALSLYVTVSDDSGISWGLDKAEIVECNLDLRSVSTEVDNPRLEASTIQVKFTFADKSQNENFMNTFQGKNVRIGYTSGYYGSRSDDPDNDNSEARVFYSTLDNDNFNYKDGIITLTGTDRVGLVNDSKSYIVKDNYRYTSSSVRCGNPENLINNYIYQMLKPFMPDLAAPTNNMAGYRYNDGTVYEYTPGFKWIDSHYSYYSNILVERQNPRDMVAQWMNIFRGLQYEETGKPTQFENLKFIFRDAGRPEAGWCKSAIGTVGSTINLQTWNLAWDDVADFEKIKGPRIKNLTMDTCDVYRSTSSADKVEFWKADVVSGIKYKINFSEPYDPDILYSNLSVLDPFNAFYNATQTTQVTIETRPYIKSSDTISCTVDADGGIKNVTLPEFSGLREFRNYPDPSNPNTYESFGWEHIIENVFTEQNNMAQQEWIEFTWRGNPHWQPRDLLRFKEKDGSYGMYEIDNFTLEHKSGGLISHVKALKRY